MVYLVYMIIGSMVTIACACICAVGKDDKPKSRKTVALVDNGGDYVLIVDKTTGELLQEYKYSSRTEWGELQYNEKRELK